MRGFSHSDRGKSMRRKDRGLACYSLAGGGPRQFGPDALRKGKGPGFIRAPIQEHKLKQEVTYWLKACAPLCSAMTCLA
jgi:hypothetical protein